LDLSFAILLLLMVEKMRIIQLRVRYNFSKYVFYVSIIAILTFIMHRFTWLLLRQSNFGWFLFIDGWGWRQN